MKSNTLKKYHLPVLVLYRTIMYQSLTLLLFYQYYFEQYTFKEELANLNYVEIDWK